MQASRVVRIVSLSLTFLLPGAIAAADDATLPPVTPFIDSEPGPPSKWTGNTPVAPDPATTRPSWWYGGRIIAADLGTVACVAATQNAVCVVPYFFAGAAIHAIHGQSGRAWLSVGLRAHMPISGAWWGVSSEAVYHPNKSPAAASPAAPRWGTSGTAQFSKSTSISMSPLRPRNRSWGCWSGWRRAWRSMPPLGSPRGPPPSRIRPPARLFDSHRGCRSAMHISASV